MRKPNCICTRGQLTEHGLTEREREESAAFAFPGARCGGKKKSEILTGFVVPGAGEEFIETSWPC